MSWTLFTNLYSNWVDNLKTFCLLICLFPVLVGQWRQGRKVIGELVNFVRVFMVARSLVFLVSGTGEAIMLGGDGWSNYVLSGYSEKAQCTGNTLSYLKPIRNSMQKTYRGVGRYWRFIKPKTILECNAEITKGGRSVLAFSWVISMLKIGRYRERQAPIKAPLNKGAIEKKSHLSSATSKNSLTHHHEKRKKNIYVPSCGNPILRK
jgi:hypothetical protein